MTQASTFAANAAAAAQRAEAAADQAEAVVGGDFATKLEAQGYVDTHNQSTDAHAALFAGKADLVDGKVPAEQLPDMDYIPNAEKGAAGGVATLGDDSKAPKEQIPELDYIPISDKGKPGGVAGLDPDGNIPQGSIDAFTKLETLDPKSAKLLGLSERSIPADMFNVLSKVGDLHVWRRTTTIKAAIPARYELGSVKTGTFKLIESYSSMNATIEYSNSVAVNDGGGLQLSSPQYIYASNSIGPDEVSVLKGKFFSITSLRLEHTTYFKLGTIYFLPYNADITWYGENGYIHNTDRYQDVTGIAKVPAGTRLDYPVSTNRNAYRDGAVSGGVTIEYLGNLGDKPRAKLISYIGTGLYGSGNPNSLNFGFVPDLVTICGGGTGDGKGDVSITVVRSASNVRSDANGGNGLYSFLFNHITWGNVFSWYTNEDNPRYQANTLNQSYYAIGIKV